MNLNSRSFIAGCLLLLVSSVSAGQKPNIVFIMADDLGWADTGFNGAEFYETPNLDKLCEAGMKFTRAYSGGPNCLPTRACLISGMYTTRTQIWTPGGRSKGNFKFMKLKTNGIVSKTTLQPSVTSIAEVLKSAGYATARFGKWHVGRDTQGFDISDPSGKGGKIGQEFYGNIHVHEWLTDASCKFIEDNTRSAGSGQEAKPFFLYLAHWDVHTPIRTRPGVKAKFDKKKKEKNWDYKWNTTYAGMIEAVDVSAGRVYAKLKELGLEKNTLFIFTSDNGGHGGITCNRPLRGGKGALFEGGIRVPTFMTWPGVIDKGSSCDIPITSVDFMPTFADLARAELPKEQPFDGVSIAPLLKGKKIEERGIFWHFPLYLNAYATADRDHPVLGTDNMYWRGVPASAMCKGDWKLMHLFEDDSIRLFNLKKDMTESKDLAKEYPEIAEKLLTELKAWQKETKAVIPTEINLGFKAK